MFMNIRKNMKGVFSGFENLTNRLNSHNYPFGQMPTNQEKDSSLKNQNNRNGNDSSN